ncbi:hypothetical protein BO78DRAFT_314052, partial [Aspergillus sclerotiicarbonarius CBS 121057]
LENKNPLNIIFLYKIIVEELQASRDYIIKNLVKGFIILSSVFFISSILIV